MSLLIASRQIRVSEKRAAIRTRTYAGMLPEEVVEMLRIERFTGRMTVDFSEGGICNLLAEDRTAIPFMAANNNHT